MHPGPKTFFQEGLWFECRRCGACCTGAPGTIYVAPAEIGPMAAYLGMTVADLIQHCLYPYQDSFSILEDAGGNCRFFDAGCRIYPVRPLQCRIFPFWFRNVRSEQRWRQTARQCPGIGHGRRYSEADIIIMAASTMNI